MPPVCLDEITALRTASRLGLHPINPSPAIHEKSCSLLDGSEDQSLQPLDYTTSSTSPQERWFEQASLRSSVLSYIENDLCDFYYGWDQSLYSKGTTVRALFLMFRNLAMAMESH